MPESLPNDEINSNDPRYISDKVAAEKFRESPTPKKSWSAEEILKSEENV